MGKTQEKISVKCDSCGKESCRWGRRELIILKRHMDNGWQPSFDGSWTCPSCNKNNGGD